MSGEEKVISEAATGVPGLDEIWAAGCRYSFNIIAGAPGLEDTLAHQAFSQTPRERPALYFTVLGEPAIKMLRYQQQFKFFDSAKLNTAVRFINLSQSVLENDLNAVLEEIVKEVETASPGMVVVDSFRTVVRKARNGTSELELQGFVQRLALHLTGWQATTFLIGEYFSEQDPNPVFTVADGLFLALSAGRAELDRAKTPNHETSRQASIPACIRFASPRTACGFPAHVWTYRTKG